MEKWGLTLQSCFKILFLPSLYIIILATFTWRCPDKVGPVPDPGGGGEDGEADHQGHQPAGLGHGAPGLGQGRVTHEDVALHRQSWEQEMRWKLREEAVEYTTINLEIISNGSFKWILFRWGELNPTIGGWIERKQQRFWENFHPTIIILDYLSMNVVNLPGY